MAFLLALAILIVTIGTVALFASGQWWFPPGASAHALLVDRQFNITLVVIAVAFVAVHLALGLAVWRFRSQRAGRASHSVGNMRLEILGAVVTLIIFATLAIFGERVWAQLYLSETPADALLVEVTGQQFVWNFRYTGPDQKFGATSPELYNDEDNAPTSRPGPVGIDPKDAAGRDDLVSVGLMVIPINRPVKLILRAKDVTHSFFVPELRFKQDAVPGMKINVHFTPTREGRYEIACAELCGIGHHRMRGFLEVRSQAEYEKWLVEKAQ
ncbi:MAG: cytochrome c oxidase subunit II [Acidobacteriota bacterium]